MYFCIFDCSPNSGLVNVNGLTMADEVYIPICADAYSLQGIKATEELIDNVSDFNVKLKIGGIFVLGGKEKRRIKQSMKWFKCNIQIFLYRIKS